VLDGARRTIWMIFIGNCEYRLARHGETFDGGAEVGVVKHRDRLSVFAPDPHA
jgi:hypothetical protein